MPQEFIAFTYSNNTTKFIDLNGREEKHYLFPSGKKEACQIVGIAYTVGADRTLQALHSVIDSQAWSKL